MAIQQNAEVPHTPHLQSTKEKPQQDDGKQKLFVLDTNVLLVDPGAIDNFEDNIVVLSMTVLEELDGLKKRSSTELEARHALQNVFKITQKNLPGEPIQLRNNGTFILHAGKSCANSVNGFDLTLEKPDNRLLATALEYKSNPAFPDRVVVVTNDAAVRVKAHAMGLASEEYEAVNFKNHVDELYTAPHVVTLSEEDCGTWLSGKPCPCEPQLEMPVLVQVNEKCYQPGNAQGGRVSPFGGLVSTLIQPLNHEQELALQTLFCDDFKIATLVGRAGTGKTILALAAAIEQKLLKNTPGKIYIFRPNDQVAQDIGFLPGRLDEKFAPHKRAIRDAYEVLQTSTGKAQKGKRLPDFEHLTNDEGGGKMPILPINFIRGSTLHDAIILIDEAQNFTSHQMKTLLTRAGKNTRVFITGDPDQIDNRFLTKRSCGLTHVIGNMRDSSIFSYVCLTQGERSEIANLAAKLL